MKNNTGKKVLIVEDESAMLDALHDAFCLSGIPALKAADGRVGLEVALTEHPDCILLDLLMPVMDGFAMLDELRKDSWGKTAKVMVLTNFSTDEVRRRAYAQKILDFIVKADFGIGEIIKRVKSVLV